MWFIKAYFKMLFSKTLWTSFFVWLLLGLSVYAVCTAEPEAMVGQAIRSTVCFIGVIMLLVLMGMLMGLAQRKWKK